MKTQVALLVTCLTTGQAFVTTSPTSKSSLKMTMSNFVDNNTNNDNKESPPLLKKPTTVEMSEAIPFLARPKVLTKELAGDFGFDPLSLAQDRETLWYYREIEIKHARLAMLVSCSFQRLDCCLKKFVGCACLDDCFSERKVVAVTNPVILAPPRLQLVGQHQSF